MSFQHTVVLFCGYAGSGKDTCFHMLKKNIDTQRVDVSKYTFGNSLKEIVVDLCQLFLNEKYSVEAMDNLEYKEMERPEHFIFSENESHPLIIRTLLQKIGTDILRKQLGQDIFAKAIISKIDRALKCSTDLNREHISFITDLRFPNEQKCIMQYCNENGHKCITIYICRNNNPLVSHSHSSESYYDQLDKDIIIQNNGTISELKNEICNLNF